jgi:MFS family permease
MDENGIYSPYRWLILLVGCLALMTNQLTMIVYAPIFGEVAKDLKIDMGAAMNLSMAFALPIGVVMVLGGIFLDRCGLTIALVLGLLCASLPAALMPWIGHSYTAVFVSRLIQGVVSISFAAIGPILALWFPRKEHGLAGGLLMCSLSVGAALGVVASPAVLGSAGSWQNTIAILSIPGWVTIALALLITRRPPSPKVVEALVGEMKSAPGDVTYKKIFASPMTWIGTLICLLSAWGFYGLLNIIPPYLATNAPIGLGLGSVMAGKLSLALALVGIPGFVVGGIFFDKIAKGNHRSAIFIGFVMMGLFTYFLLLPGVYENMFLLVLCLMAAGWGGAFIGPSLSAFIAENYPPKFVGSMVGWWFGVGTFGGGTLATYVAGLSLARLGTFYWAITPVSLAACAGLVLGFFLKPWRKSEEVEILTRTL